MKKFINSNSNATETIPNLYQEFTDSNSIRIKYFDKEMPELARIKKGDWIDLYSRETVTLKTGESYLVPLNVAMKLPDGYEAILAPRSGTFKKYGVLQTNSIGVIDNSYSGNNDEWKMSVYATRDTIINKGDRIAQFRIQKKMSEFIMLQTVDHLEGPDRGGFGSTGV